MGLKNSLAGYLLSGLLHGVLLFSITHSDLKIEEEKQTKPLILSLRTLKVVKKEKKTPVKTKKIVKLEKGKKNPKRKITKVKKRKAFKENLKRHKVAKKVTKKKKKLKKVSQVKSTVVVKKNQRISKVAQNSSKGTNVKPVVHKKEEVTNSASETKVQKTVTVGMKTQPPYRERFLKTNFEKIRNFVQKRIKYPYIARRMGWEGRVILEIVLSKNGCESVRVVRSSGHKVLDNNALETVRALCGKFPKPEKRVTLRLPVSYILK